MEYFEVYKRSSLTKHMGQELKTKLPMRIKERLKGKGFKEKEDCYRIPLSMLMEVKEWRSVLPVIKNNVA